MFENKPKDNGIEVQDLNAQKTNWKAEILDIVKVFIISLVIVVPIRYFIVQPFIVRGASMEPNFKNRDYLIVDEVSYRFREPQRGEAIIFRYPRDPKQYFIKRIIGLPGETVEIKNGKIKIFSPDRPDGHILEEPYLNSYNLYPALTTNLNKNQYFVLGDNRNFSYDSRGWGPLDRKFIIGKAVFRAWPVTKFGFVAHYALNY